MSRKKTLDVGRDSRETPLPSVTWSQPTAEKSSDWEIQIIAPNGSNAHMKLDASLSAAELVSQFDQFIASVIENDLAEDKTSAGGAQERKTPKGA